MIRFKRLLLPALLLAGSFAGTARAQDATTPIAITNVRIFDGTRVIPKGTVVFQGDRIAAVGADVLPPAAPRSSTAAARPSCRASSTAIPTPGATR